MDIGRISIGSMEGVHGVVYDAQGKAHCNEETHQWKTGEDFWDERSKKGYISFGDRYLGTSVSHKVAVKPGESYGEFWTRINAAKKAGYIETAGSSAYSAKDVVILKAEIEGIEIEKKSVDSDALRGMSYQVGDKTIYPYGKSDTDKPGVVGKISQGVAGLSLLVVMALVFVAYLVLQKVK